jgi:ethanolamine utilization protein EutP
MKKWRYMLWGGVGAGKTTLMRTLQGGAPASKTQMIEYDGEAIDTPGEYAESGRFVRHLQSTSSDAALILVVQDATRTDCNFPPNYFRMFSKPVLGMVSKMDDPDACPERAESILRSIGVTGEVFYVSAVTKTGLSELRQNLQERRNTWLTTTGATEKRSV